MPKVLSTGSGWIWLDTVDPGQSETNVSQGNLWLNTATNDVFICKVPTIASQVWDKYTQFTALTSFTPVLTGTSAAGTATYTTQLGRYCKTGSLVFCWINLAWSATTGTGNTLITGLPFSANAAFTPTCDFVFSGITLGVGGLSIVGQISGTQIALSNPITGSALTALALPASGTLQTSFVYST